MPETPAGERPPADRVRIYGARGEDGILTSAQAVAGTGELASSLLNGLATRGRRQESVAGSTVHLDRVPGTGLTVVTDSSKASDVAVLGFGVDDEALLAVIEPLLDGGRGRDALDPSTVPAGLEQLYDGPSTPLPHAEGGDAEVVVVAMQDGATVWQMAAYLGEEPSSVVSELMAGRTARRLAVGDRKAVVQGGAESPYGSWSALWQERAGVTVQLSGYGATEDIPAVIAGVREVSSPRWQAFVEHASEAADQEPADEGSTEDDATPSGPATEVSIGEGEARKVYTLTPGTIGGEDVVCAVPDTVDRGPGDFCTPPGPDRPAVHVNGWGTSGGSTYVLGFVDAAVVRVRIEAGTVDMEVAPAGAEAGLGVALFTADLPPQEGMIEVAGFDEAGREVLRTRVVLGS